MTIVGIDEVGRGCWAGPLVAGAVILNRPIKGLRDSKKLSKSQREVLAAKIFADAYATGLGWVWPAEIDACGLTWAVKTAMAAALQAIQTPYDEVIIDGNFNYLPHVAVAKAMIKADDSVPSVSAASIIAKVARDRYMSEQATLYPEYGFEAHVGYGTKRHREALHMHGVLAGVHRQSYKPLQSWLPATIKA